MTPTQQLQEQILSLQSALISANPGIPTMLRTIHTALRVDKDLVTLLSPEEKGVIVQGLMSITNTIIATAAVKGTGSKKALSKLTLDDL